MERADSEPTLEEPAQLEPALAPEDAAPGVAGERARTDSEVEALRDGDGDDAPRLGFEAAATGVEWREGDAVEVFYRTLEDGNGGYFPTTSPSDCLRSPVARTDCWVPAVVVRDYQGWRDERVVVRHTHEHWRDARGQRLDMRDEANAVQRSHTYAAGLMEAIHGRVGTSYEAVTAYVASTDDLRSLCERRLLDLVAGCDHYGALYLLWPTQFDDGTAGRPGMVPASPFFDLMQRLEGAGIPSRFPHAAHVYRTLVSKEWTSHLGAVGALAVPPTTRVNLSAIERDAEGAARRAVDALKVVGRDFKARRPKDGGAKPWTRGVAKLGHSWEAIDVRAWRGKGQLRDALRSLARQPGCRADYVFVQEFVEAVGEVRAYCVDGKLEKLLYTRFDDPDAGDEPVGEEDQGRFVTFSELERADAVQQWFRGDEALADAAEREVRTLVGRWLAWLRGLDSEPLPFVRVDVFVCVHDDPATGAPKLSVATGELTELGAGTSTTGRKRDRGKKKKRKTHASPGDEPVAA
ncbi:hypothetical protein JL722_9785 [Aureococcus anophagefferens]|nr:hypothetical protein JL722_9785 [Aureococcus anophagefferens]